MNNWCILRVREQQYMLKSTMKNYSLIPLLLLIIGHYPVMAQQNPTCYVCFDGGVSQITRPNTQIPLPAILNMGETISCEQIRLAAEVFMLVPEEVCPILNFPAFRVACGCENAWTSAPQAAPVAVRPPTREKQDKQTQQMKAASNTVSPMPSYSPTVSPSSSPTLKPTAFPTKAPVLVGQMGMKNVQGSSTDDIATSDSPSESPSIVKSDYPSLTLRDVPELLSSDYPSSIPSDSPSAGPSSTPSNLSVGDQLVDVAREIIDNIDENATWQTLFKILVAVLNERLTDLLEEDQVIDADVLSDTPSDAPSTVFSDVPSNVSSDVPSTIISDIPSTIESNVPTVFATELSILPTTIDDILPELTLVPFGSLSDIPSSVPSGSPSDTPSSVPSGSPSDTPSSVPSGYPSDTPSSVPSGYPSDTPSNIPSTIPSDTVSSVPSEVASILPTTNEIVGDVPSILPTTVEMVGEDIDRDTVPTITPITEPPVDENRIFLWGFRWLLDVLRAFYRRAE